MSCRLLQHSQFKLNVRSKFCRRNDARGVSSNNNENNLHSRCYRDDSYEMKPLRKANTALWVSFFSLALAH